MPSYILISFIFQQGDISEAGSYPSFFNALHWLGSKTTYFYWFAPHTDTFTFHQLLHHKRSLLKDEKQLLKSAKQIVINFITSLEITIIKKLPVGEKLQVK
jgi:hypothetical protein